MVKAPVAGAVKTRLARGIGAVGAACFYRHATAALIHRLGTEGRWRTWLAVAPDGALGDGFWPAHIPRIGQGRGDLGARMQRILDRFAPAPTIIIGSDIPGVRAAHVGEAFARLAGAHGVLGPSGDGGYWLVGLRGERGRRAGAFAGVRWSSPHALADTRANLARARRRIAIAATLRDVDEACDLAALAGAAGRVVPPVGALR